MLTKILPLIRGLALLILCGCLGCVQQKDGTWVPWDQREQSPAPSLISSNIVAVNKFFSNVPWLIFDNDGTGRVDGVKITVYLQPAGGVKGVFGTGTLVVEMYRIDRGPDGREIPTLVQDWNLPPVATYPWRSKKAFAMGWGYGLRLRWDKHVDVAGRKVVFLIKYVREDGRVISSSRQVLRVPAPGGDGIGLNPNIRQPRTRSAVSRGPTARRVSVD